MSDKIKLDQTKTRRVSKFIILFLIIFVIVAVAVVVIERV